MTDTYQHPSMYRPPLADGGHQWWRIVKVKTNNPTWGSYRARANAGGWATCMGCFVTVPAWALYEGFSTTFAGRWCLGAQRALPAVYCDECGGMIAGEPCTPDGFRVHADCCLICNPDRWETLR